MEGMSMIAVTRTHTYCTHINAHTRSVARKETLDVHQKNWVCHINCQINAKKKKKHAYWVLIC